MSRLNETAKAELRAADVSQVEWARANWSETGQWHGDACGCPDERCIGFHHYETEDCGCLRTLLQQYLSGEPSMMFATTRTKP